MIKIDLLRSNLTQTKKESTMKRFFKEWGLVVIILALALALVLWVNLTSDYLSIMIMLGCLLLLLFMLVVIVLGAMAIFAGFVKSGKMQKEGIPPIIYEVPPMTRWVIRFVWRKYIDTSNSYSPKGYLVFGEGWQWWLPYLVHKHVDFVNLKPVPHDPDPYPINTIDAQTVGLDLRFVERILQEKENWDHSDVRDNEELKKICEENPGLDNVLLYVLKVPKGKRDELMEQILTKAANVVTAKYAAITYPDDNIEKIFGKKKEELEEGRTTGLLQFSRDQLNRLEKEIKKLANEEAIQYGLWFDEVGVQNVVPKGELEKAFKRRAAAAVELETVRDEVAAVKQWQEAKIPPALAFIVNQLLDAFRDILGGGEIGGKKAGERKESKSEKEKKKEKEE